MSHGTARQLAKLRKAWNSTPTVDRIAFLLEAIAAGALHKQSLAAKTRTNLLMRLAPQMEKASNAVRSTGQELETHES